MKKVHKCLLGFILVSSLALVSFKFDDRYFEIAKNLDIFATLFKELNNLYVDEINPNEAMQASITAMLERLDPYTNFYAEEQIEDYRTMNAGKYNGIGANVSERFGEHQVVMIYENSPADEAGLKIGDVITEINNVSLKGRNNEEMGRLLKGQTGTSVELSVKRFGQKKPLKISLKRAVVKTPNVPHYGLIDNEIGYIQLKDFSATAATEIKSAFDEMKADGMKKLILDLRGNPGGLLNMSIDICNFFLDKGQLIVETKGKVAEWNKKYMSLRDPIDLEIPIIVLINNSSASASEIVSGTLQDYDRGVVIGQKSYGKGLVQTTRKLPFNTQMKVTTAKYYIPSGRCIQAIDYSHRNPDGSIGKVPDSLKSAFYTKNGRLVYDGGGIDPDLDLPPKMLSELTSELIEQGIIFDYATKYYFEHEADIPQDNFKPSDNTYAQFLEFVKKSDFEYVNETSDALAQLESLIKKEDDYKNLRGKVAELRAEIDKKMKADFVKYKEEIEDELALEILSRYHYDKAMKFVSFEKDQEVQASLALFRDMNKYKSILAGKK